MWSNLTFVTFCYHEFQICQSLPLEEWWHFSSENDPITRVAGLRPRAGGWRRLDKEHLPFVSTKPIATFISFMGIVGATISTSELLPRLVAQIARHNAMLCLARMPHQHTACSIEEIAGQRT
jgi:hypothetical protein